MIFGTDEQTRELLDYAAEFNDLSIEASERTARMKQYRDELNQARDVGMRDRVMNSNANGDTDYGRRGVTTDPKRHRIPLPIGRATTVKHAFRISGRLPDVVVDRRESRRRSATARTPSRRSSGASSARATATPRSLRRVGRLPARRGLLRHLLQHREADPDVPRARPDHGDRGPRRERPARLPARLPLLDRADSRSRRSTARSSCAATRWTLPEDRRRPQGTVWSI
jgi:hypothetical protein